MGGVIKIPYTPRYPHVHAELEAHRFSVLVAHRRFGKTVLAINHLLKAALRCQLPMGCYGYVGPILKQTKKVAWQYIKRYTQGIPGRKINEAELRVDLPNGASIWLYGTDNPDSIRGSYFDGVVIDEVAQIKPEVWSDVIQPMLADRKGWAVFIGTPKGVNLFSEIYYGALDKIQKGRTDWCALCYPVTETSALDAEEVARLRDELSDNAFRQELLCDFSASSDNNLLTTDEVMQSMAACVDMEVQQQYPLIIGVDVARFGDDNTVFFPRRGLHAYPPKILHGLSNTDVARQLAGYADELKPAYICIDQGQGTGVIDLVQEILAHSRIQVLEIPFGSRALDADKYANRRAEMWLLMRDWIRSGGHLPERTDLQAELTAPLYFYDNQGRIRLEPKEQIKERLAGKSTDLADALALTFAVPSVSQTAREWEQRQQAPRSYDPFAATRQQAPRSYDPFADNRRAYGW